MTTQARFPAVSRLLHWLMAPMIVAMLFIGVGMVASVSARYELLVSIHRPLGIAIFVLCVIRFVNRFINPPPELPDTVPSEPAGMPGTDNPMAVGRSARIAACKRSRHRRGRTIESRS
jgi:cytochrome b561